MGLNRVQLKFNLESIMNLSSVSVILLAVVSLVCATDVNNGTDIFCHVKDSESGKNASISAVRIAGCEREPCDVKKGVKTPIEIEFYFEAPKSADKINLRVFASYWNVPGTGAYGSYIAEESKCENLQLESCPAVAFRRHTLKSHLYADPELESTVGKGSTGNVRTSWTLSPSDKNDYALCTFTVWINLTN